LPQIFNIEYIIYIVSYTQNMINYYALSFFLISFYQKMILFLDPLDGIFLMTISEILLNFDVSSFLRITSNYS